MAQEFDHALLFLLENSPRRRPGPHSLRRKTPASGRQQPHLVSHSLGKRHAEAFFHGGAALGLNLDHVLEVGRQIIGIMERHAIHYFRISHPGGTYRGQRLFSAHFLAGSGLFQHGRHPFPVQGILAVRVVAQQIAGNGNQCSLSFLPAGHHGGLRGILHEGLPLSSRFQHQHAHVVSGNGGRTAHSGSQEKGGHGFSFKPGAELESSRFWPFVPAFPAISTQPPCRRNFFRKATSRAL